MRSRVISVISFQERPQLERTFGKHQFREARRTAVLSRRPLSNSRGGCGLQVGHPGVRKGVRMYDKRAKQDALDLWFSMPGEMSVDDFAAELGYPSGSTLRNWIKADPRHDPDKCQYRSKPVLPKLEAIRRVAEGATAARAARETGLTPSRCATAWEGTPEGARRRCCQRPRGRRKGEAVDEGRPAGRAGRPARCPASSRRGCRRSCPTTRRRSRRSSPTWSSSNAALREVLAVLKAGAPALTNAEAAGCASGLEGAFGAAAACAAWARPAPPTTTSSTP